MRFVEGRLILSSERGYFANIYTTRGTSLGNSTPAGVTVAPVRKSSLPAIFIGERFIVYATLHHSLPPADIQEGTVCLSGDLLGSKVEHNMKFNAPLAVRKDNMSQVSTIHHLAAKRSIKEMELSNDSSPGMIRLSCDSNVISSQTAFIAIDEERKEAVKGSLQTWDILSVEGDVMTFWPGTSFDLVWLSTTEFLSSNVDLPPCLCMPTTTDQWRILVRHMMNLLFSL